jgi:uncharacterized protein
MTSSASALAYAATAPAFEVDGRVKRDLARDLLRLEVEHDTLGLATLQARFIGVGASPSGDAEALLHLDGSTLDFGRELRVSVGPADVAAEVFLGRITALEAELAEARAPQVGVFAEDALMNLRMTRRTRTYENVTDADVAAQIADEHGLSASTAADGPSYAVVQQMNQSDLAFLRDRARLVGAELWAEGRTLLFQTRPNRSGSELTLVAGNELIDARLRADLAHQRTKVRVSGYDADDRAVIDEEAGDEAILAETSGGRTGPSVLQQAFGERISHRSRDVPLTGPEAAAWARDELKRRARAFATVTGTTDGSPALAVGSRLALERVGAPFEGGGWYVTRVRHTYDLEHGHRTHFEAERPTVSS